MVFELPPRKRTNKSIWVRECPKCPRSEQCKIPTTGKGKKQILIVMDEPTKYQYQEKSWLGCAESGQGQWVFPALMNPNSDWGIENIYNDCWVTGVLRCYTGAPDPKPKYECCLADLQSDIETLKPKVIITIGSVATGAVLRCYNPDHFAANYTTNKYNGYAIPLIMPYSGIAWNTWLVPVVSDTEINSNNIMYLRQIGLDCGIKSLTELCPLVQEPLPKPISRADVRIVSDEKEILKALEVASLSNWTAFDYETNCLHPEVAKDNINLKEKPKVLTAAIAYCNDKNYITTVAFTFNGNKKIIAAWKEFLQSPTLKIGANIKFEHRWGLVHFGVETLNWAWDVCIGARIFNAQPGMASLKTTSFIHFGVIGYDDDVDEAMKKTEEMGMNRLEALPPETLLLYNGYDSLLTLRCYFRQQELLAKYNA